jgi:hypothetical protein
MLLATVDTQVLPGLALLLALVCIYFLPTIISGVRDKAEGGGGVFIVNLLLGWTLIGWFVAFIWACTGRTKPDLRQDERRHAELIAAVSGKSPHR